MAAIFSFLKLCQHSTGAECDKVPFGENHFSISLFANEIIQINRNSRWLPGGPQGSNFLSKHISEVHWPNYHICKFDQNQIKTVGVGVFLVKCYHTTNDDEIKRQQKFCDYCSKLF